MYLSPQKTCRLIMSFEDYADQDVPLMCHCHLLVHEDEGMMGQFTVTRPADAPGVPGRGADQGTCHFPKASARMSEVLLTECFCQQWSARNFRRPRHNPPVRTR